MIRPVQRPHGAPRLGRGGALAIAVWLLASVSIASAAHAALKGVTIAPVLPTTCDSVSIVVSGDLPSSCHEVVGATILGPAPIPCLRPTPCPSRFTIEITVREPNPLILRPCVVPALYARTFAVGKLPAGEYIVGAHERVIPFSADSTDSVASESFASASFIVGPDSTCSPATGCYMLSFKDPLFDPPAGSRCDVVVAAGETACLSLRLTNTEPVAGLQTTVQIMDAVAAPAIDVTPVAVSVTPVGRAAGFLVGWTTGGQGNTRLILYSTTGATIEPGNGPVVRICYGIPPIPGTTAYLVSTGETIVANAAGDSVPPCPTFAAEPPGVICVGSQPCDVNGDGVSDVLDVIRLVRCALGSSSDSVPACPDSIAARADCNGDGLVDVRDVVCCVRKIVQLVPGPAPGPLQKIGAGPLDGNGIGFEGPIRWTDAVDGLAVVRVDAAADWGGTQFWIDPSTAPVRVREVRLDGAAATDQMAWWVADDGVAHVMLYTTSLITGPARSYRIEIALEREPSNAGSGALRIGNVRAGSAAGAGAPVTEFNPTLSVVGSAVLSAALLGARPNPFAGRTQVGFVLPADARASLRIYDVGGRLVRVLVEGPTPAGVHRVDWDGADDRGRAARSGIYFAKLTAGATNRTERILLLR